MKTTKKTVTKDDTISRKDKKKGEPTTTITSTDRATGTKRGTKGPDKAGAKSQANAEKKSGVSSTGATRVKNDPQVDEKFSSKKGRNL